MMIIEDGTKNYSNERLAPLPTGQSQPEPVASTTPSAAINPWKLYFLLPFELIAQLFQSNKKSIKLITYILLLLTYSSYFLAALILDFQRAENLVIVTAIAVFCVVYWAIKKYCGNIISQCCLQPVVKVLRPHSRILKW